MTEDDQQLKKYFDSHVDEFDYSSSTAAPMLRRREDLIFERALPAVKARGGRILEIGCGTGHLVARFLQAGVQTVGIDMSPGMIERGKRELERLGHGVESLCALDLFASGCEELGRFEVVIANGVIMYYPDQSAFLRRVRGVLQDGGEVLIVHRNALFNLFALNRGTLELIESELLSPYPPPHRESVMREIRSALPGLTREVGHSTNSSLNRSAENPLEVSEIYIREGLRIVDIVYTSIHSAPPWIPIKENPSQATLSECERSWRGMFMGSQFIVHATTAE